MEYIGYLVLAILGGAFWLWENSKLRSLEIECAVYEEKLKYFSALEQSYSQKEKELQEVQIQKAALDEKLRFSQEAEQQMARSFRALSADALEKNNRSFLDLAKTVFEKFQEGAKGDLEKRQQSISELFNPVKEALGKLDIGMRQLEKERKGEQAALKEQVRTLLESEGKLRLETANLVRALRTPIHRGRWGEVQLRRVVELAGMVNHCDFFTVS